MGRDVAGSIVGVKRTLWVDKEEVDAGRHKSYVIVTQSHLIYRWCLQSSTTESHEYLKLELSGVREPRSVRALCDMVQ